MIGYNLKDLESYNDSIEVIVKNNGLDCYEQQFEIVSYEDMLCYEAYVGMPSHYPHWSYGKAYERQRTFYQYNLVGLPYEMVINSNPCIAYLMRDNTLALQILTMAHVYAHNDFFKNNRLFKRDTRAELTVEMFKAHANRVRQYLQDPFIGLEKVERILDAAHALKFNAARHGQYKYINRKEMEKQANELLPEVLKDDLLLLLAEKGKLENWEKDLINIVRAETLYFIPQIETKIMNEGWASYWHYNILKQLKLPENLHLEFLQRHNLVVRPFEGTINPYFVGFKMFEYLAEHYSIEKIMEIRAEERDQSFLRRYLNQELCEELHLFTYGVRGSDMIVKEVSDEAGWQNVRDNFVNNVGLGMIPVIKPVEIDKGTLVLEHVFDGRELEINYAKETIKYIVSLWGNKVILKTNFNNKNKIISCDENQIVTVMEA